MAQLETKEEAQQAESKANTAPTTATESAPTRAPEPPRWLTSTLRYVLRSPLHGIFSKTITLLVFRGRKTGKIYTTPVDYLLEGNVVTAFTDSRWYHNLTGGAPVTVYLKGKPVDGYAEVIDKRDAVTDGLTHYLLKVPGDAKYYGVTFDANGQPIREQIERGSQHHVMLRIQLAAPVMWESMGGH